MPDIRTEVTEIVTALGMMGLTSVDEALSRPPAAVRNVGDDQWDRLRAARSAGDYAAEFKASWENGRAFLASPDALRSRVPAIIEWKGAHQPPGFDQIPADLRVDHVYLVSCKYQSKILTNSSPTNLFERRLADRTEARNADSWYVTCAPEAYATFYGHVRDHLGRDRFPADSKELRSQDLRLIRGACTRRWPKALVPHWERFSSEVAEASASRWRTQLPTPRRQEEMLWRLLRLSPAPYYVLGASRKGEKMRLRIGTPWDWRQGFELQSMSISAGRAGQPRVNWSAVIRQRADGVDVAVDGHVEVRWAHGRFSAVEAKVYLDTPHRDVPGYFPLA